MNLSRTSRLAVVAWALALAHTVMASPLPVVIGVSASLSGPLASQGQEFVRGLNLAVDQASAAGGVAGRQTTLRTLDDAGLEGLCEPLHPLPFNLCSGIQDEVAAMVIHLDSAGISGVAVVSQGEALGRAGRHGMNIELAWYSIRPSASVELPASANEAAVRAAVDQACQTHPQALVLMLDPTLAMTEVKHARQSGCARLIYLFSDVASRLLAQGAALPQVRGFVVAQVVPYPEDFGSGLIKALHEQIRDKQLRPGYAMVEGFLCGRVVVGALTRSSRELSKCCVAKAPEVRGLDVDGLRLSFSPTDHRGMHFVEMTIVGSDGHFRR